MRAILLDTHTFAWALQGPHRLSSVAILAIDSADTAYLSAASLYEITLKVRLGKWNDMEPFAANPLHYLASQSVEIAALDAGVCLRAGSMDWYHRDPFDRLIAATALERGMPIVSLDKAFDGVVSRIW